MKLEVGKRYVMRNGEVTGALECCENLSGWFKDSRNTWREDGLWSSADVTGAYDIVAEYVEPEPQQPLRWVENCKPDKPGIWAVLENDRQYVRQIDRLDLYGKGTWCYVGPIPEILPPKKKVVQRLWIDYCEPNDGKVLFAWFVDGETFKPEGRWIRTDETREREIKPRKIPPVPIDGRDS